MQESHSVSRRDFMKSVGVSAFALALAACAPTVAPAGGGAQAPAAQTIDLTYWHSWTEQWEEMTKFVCDSFNRKNPGLKATETVIPGNELMTKLLSSIAAGNPPDMITIYSGDQRTLSGRTKRHPVAE